MCKVENMVLHKIYSFNNHIHFITLLYNINRKKWQL
jgi:hypothetical protein